MMLERKKLNWFDLAYLKVILKLKITFSALLQAESSSKFGHKTSNLLCLKLATIKYQIDRGVMARKPMFRKKTKLNAACMNWG